MARRIIEVETITVESGSAEISIPIVDKAIGNYKDGSEWYPSDSVVYVFQNFTGSFLLTQESGSQSGIRIYDTNKYYNSGPWNVRSAPKWLFNSGSNSQSVEVAKILIR